MKLAKVLQLLKNELTCTWRPKNSIDAALLRELDNLNLIEYRTFEFVPRWNGNGFGEVKVKRDDFRIIHNVLEVYKDCVICLKHPKQDLLYAYDLGEHLTATTWSENVIATAGIFGYGWRVPQEQALAEIKTQLDELLERREVCTISLF